MARSPNCTGAPLFKGRVDVTITYPDPYEPPLLDPAEALPTSEPTTAQIEITITSAMLPVWSPFELEHIKTAVLYVSGKNTNTSTVSVYYRLLKNGVSVATGSGGVGAGNFYGATLCQFFDAVEGDVVACKLWSNIAGCNWDFKGLGVMPTRIRPQASVVSDIAMSASKRYPGFSIQGAYFREFLYIVHDDSFAWGVDTDMAARAAISGPLYGLTRVGRGDMIQGGVVSQRSDNRQFYLNMVPTRISYTPLNLRV
jgi:hypothetical protein